MKFPSKPEDFTPVDDDEAETADYYVCVKASKPSIFHDDLFDFCSKCGEKVRHRPHGPTIPKKICMECALEIHNFAPDEIEHMISLGTKEEFMDYLEARKRKNG